VLLGEIEAQKARAIAEATELRSSGCTRNRRTSDQVETLRSSYAMGLRDTRSSTRPCGA